MLRNSSKTSALNVAIVGCGPAGLASALVLDNLGHKVSLFERFETPEPVGSGIILQPTGLRVLEELGLYDQAIAAGQRIDRIVGNSAPSMRRVLNVNYSSLGAEQFGVAIHRGALFEVLLDAVAGRGIEINTGVEVVDDRSLDGFKLIVDASGARSALRRQAEHEPRDKPLQFGAIWGSFEWPGEPFIKTQLEQRYVDAHTMIGVLPLGRGVAGERDQLAFFWSLPNDQYSSWTAAGLDVWKAAVRKIWPETESILEQIVSTDQMTMANYGHHTMRVPHVDNIVFVGDAAHATSPQLGQGANMALLDAWALGNALQRHSVVSRALPFYAASRRWHVRCFQFASLALTPFYQSNSRVLSWLRDQSFDAISRVPGCRRIVAGLISGMLGDPLGKIGLEPRRSLGVETD